MRDPLDLIRKYWRFDDNQHHTHSWHDREDFIDKVLRPYLESQSATIARLTAERDAAVREVDSKSDLQFDQAQAHLDDKFGGAMKRLAESERDDGDA